MRSICSCSVRGPAIGAVRLGATRAVVVTSASRGASASRCERADGSCASRSARRDAPSLPRGPAAAAILPIARKRRAAKTQSEVLFLWLEIFPGDLPNPSRMDKQSRKRITIKGMGRVRAHRPSRRRCRARKKKRDWKSLSPRRVDMHARATPPPERSSPPSRYHAPSSIAHRRPPRPRDL